MTGSAVPMMAPSCHPLQIAGLMETPGGHIPALRWWCTGAQSCGTIEPAGKGCHSMPRCKFDRSLIGSLLGGAFAIAALAGGAQAQAPSQQALRDIYRELVEINTTDATGDTVKAAQAMAARLKAAGFPAGDIRVISTGPRKGNLVARLRGTGARKPMLLLAHIDVVPPGDGLASRSVQADRDRGRLFPWTRRHRRQGDGRDLSRQSDRISSAKDFEPERDIILALTTDEELRVRRTTAYAGSLSTNAP